MKAKESKHIYLKFFTLIIICGFLGGLASFLLNYPGFDVVDSVQLLQNNILAYGLYISSAGSAVLMLITALFYLSARNTYRQLETNDSDALYEKADHLCDTGIIFGNITLIFTLLFTVSMSAAYTIAAPLPFYGHSRHFYCRLSSALFSRFSL